MYIQMTLKQGLLMHKNKILIVPDVHGRKFWIEALSKIDMVDKVVFLGDYLDPYPWEDISKLDAIKEFKDIIEFKRSNPDKVILLLGNHDCAYCFDFGSASRYDYENEFEIKSLFKENMDIFRLYYKEGKYLFSHAGITNDWLKTYLPEYDMERFTTLTTKELIPFLWKVSFYRGGSNNTGSIIWSDVEEGDRESTFYQIFGHTQLEKDPIINNTYACLDVRKCFLLDTEDGTILEYDD